MRQTEPRMQVMVGEEVVRESKGGREGARKRERDDDVKTEIQSG